LEEAGYKRNEVSDVLGIYKPETGPSNEYNGLDNNIAQKNETEWKMDEDEDLERVMRASREDEEKRRKKAKEEEDKKTRRHNDIDASNGSWK